MKPQILSGSAVFVFPGCGVGVAAPVFSCCLWSHGCSGRRVACLVGRAAPWAAARPRAVRAASRTCCVLLLVAPLVFRAPSGPAAREIATREPKGSEWSISKPARALRTLRHPPHRRRLRCWCVAWCVVSMPGQALPPPVVIAGASRAAFAGRSFACCYKRRQSKVFFEWISDPLLQTSSIRRLFR